ncbi:flagellar hook-length control protein FliK [Periweissella fabaria]|uniref:Flagellar hook-length control protein-like C-terminal domain-containing protein n=1 Tax=Periweissella fabaria TaxID=546157 RepID=A0ABM8Z6B5_9LACO|nr:flagellar hook-length control protein FliK [Periweissella fabaria]MCM0597015.1 flagellar hook-length control protein FliK [Periweissella fabaria]CAH0416970.1 hypothetical protein WFA24289_01287 [Periweissella fabaria]
MNQITPPTTSAVNTLSKNSNSAASSSDDNQALAAIFASLLAPSPLPMAQQDAPLPPTDNLVQAGDDGVLGTALPSQSPGSLSVEEVPIPQAAKPLASPVTDMGTSNVPAPVNSGTAPVAEVAASAAPSTQSMAATNQPTSAPLASDNSKLNKDSKSISNPSNDIFAKNVTNSNDDVIKNFEASNSNVFSVEKTLPVTASAPVELKAITPATGGPDSATAQRQATTDDKAPAPTTGQLPSQAPELPLTLTGNIIPNQVPTITNTPVLTTVKIESQPLMPTNQISNMAQVITEQVKTMGSGDTKVVVFRLEPAGLGPINVNLQINQQQVSVEFKMEQSQTHQMLAAAMPKLQEILKATTDMPLQINNPTPTPAVTNVSAPTSHTLSDMNQQMMFNQQGQHGHGQPFTGDKRKAYQGPQEVVVEPVETQPAADATVSILV